MDEDIKNCLKQYDYIAYADGVVYADKNFEKFTYRFHTGNWDIGILHGCYCNNI